MAPEKLAGMLNVVLKSVKWRLHIEVLLNFALEIEKTFYKIICKAVRICEDFPAFPCFCR